MIEPSVRAALIELLGAPITTGELKRKPSRLTLRARGPSGTAIVKLYRSDRAPRVAQRVAALAGGPASPGVPRVLLLRPELGLVALTDMPGVPLREAIVNGDLEGCTRAGAALGAWHAAFAGAVPAPLREHTPARELEALERQAASLDKAGALRVRRAAQGLAPRWTCSTAVHRDLYEEQILLGAETVSLIDLDDAASGPPELDLGNLLAHLELLERRRGAPVDAAAAALLAGYGAAAAPLDDDLLDRCRRLTLLRLSCVHRDPMLHEMALRS